MNSKTELHEIERPAIDMEEYLLMKFKAELGNCQKARIKTGLGAVKEIVGIYCDHSITLSESGIITLYIN